jgi:hypothetical protein
MEWKKHFFDAMLVLSVILFVLYNSLTDRGCVGLTIEAGAFRDALVFGAFFGFIAGLGISKAYTSIFLEA